MKAKNIISVIAEDKRFTQVKKPLAGILTGLLALKRVFKGGSTELRSKTPGLTGCIFLLKHQNQALNIMGDMTVISGGC